jgi:hypothetical protein
LGENVYPLVHPRQDMAAPPRTEALGYVLDMIEQLARIAEREGDMMLASMLDEVSRRASRP